MHPDAEKADSPAQPGPLEKHKKYHKSYKPNDIFWGLGIEHEVYLELTEKRKEMSLEEIKRATKRERYSHNYFTSYKPKVYATAIDYLIGQLGPATRLQLPVLMNAHSFQKTDMNGEHATLYVKGPATPNPAYSGVPMLEYLKARDAYFAEELGHSYLFDGDTIEFTTLDFYNATPAGVIAELRSAEEKFCTALNALSATPLRIAPKNYGLATYLTNRENVAIFNNGTVHVNITLPTRLDGAARIADWPDFVERHRRLARLFQWFEPLLVAMFCTPDPFLNVPALTASVSHASQRVAVSRYIGLGTFDTVAMQRGKLLTLDVSAADPGWYGAYHAGSAYVPLEKIGLDINFNKHYNHGLELRFFDSMPLEKMEEVLEACCLISGAAEGGGWNIPDPRESAMWNGLVVGVMRGGKGHILSVEERRCLEGAVRMAPAADLQPISVEEMYITLMKEYRSLYGMGKMMGFGATGDAKAATTGDAEPTTGDLKSTEPAAAPALAPVPTATTTCSVPNIFSWFSRLRRRGGGRS